MVPLIWESQESGSWRVGIRRSKPLTMREFAHVAERHRLDRPIKRAITIPPHAPTVAGPVPRDGPERYGALRRFETMPSRPILQAC
jgi:hypothetical protein